MTATNDLYETEADTTMCKKMERRIQEKYARTEKKNCLRRRKREIHIKKKSKMQCSKANERSEGDEEKKYIIF